VNKVNIYLFFVNLYIIFMYLRLQNFFLIFIAIDCLTMTSVPLQTAAASQSSAPTIQVRLTTKTETPISSTPIVIPTNVTRYNLSQILNHLLENAQPIPYSFLINGVYLPASLDEYIIANDVSREEVLEIEYVRSVLPPTWEGRWSQEDWIGGVSALDTGVVSGGYDGIVRVWDWSGNILAKGRGGEGVLEPVKCVKWIEGGLVSGAMDGSMRVWSWEDETLSLVLKGKGHEMSVDSVDYRDGKVISASADATLRLWTTNPDEGDNAAATETSTKRKRRKTETSHPTKVFPPHTLLTYSQV
jgi:ribosome biogenesis protein